MGNDAISNLKRALETVDLKLLKVCQPSRSVLPSSAVFQPIFNPMLQLKIGAIRKSNTITIFLGARFQYHAIACKTEVNH
jgi:hypothetical protein